MRWQQHARRGFSVAVTVACIVAAVGESQGENTDDTELCAGDLVLTLHKTDTGIAVQSLTDAKTGRALFAGQPLPLFTLKMRHIETKDEITLDAVDGWTNTDIIREDNLVELHWLKRDEQAGHQWHVIARAVLDHEHHAIRWNLSVTNDSQAWSLMHVVFPQMAIGKLGADGCIFFPRGVGEVEIGLWQRGFHHRGFYPEPWMSMQFMAAYTATGDAGLYIGAHDPYASIKDMIVTSRPPDAAVDLIFDHPVENMTLAGNDYATSGEVVWQIFRGDWYDAALIYRDWVRREAKWYPKLGPDGREDTPLWMREMPFWFQGGGDGVRYAEKLAEVQQLIGVPTAVHWYNWHQIPFDNDYPHYFPTDEGFTEGVRAMKDANIRTMPYINGRLWDTRDRGAEDFEFTRIARPAAAKNEAGEVIAESYGSKESDGEPVKLAVMCPTQELWHARVLDICSRLLNDEKVDAVYIDQIAAMHPVLCMDPDHGHPLGGGHWWTEGYWDMMKSIRQSLPPDTALTSECTSEPYIKWFDGYLTWHCQHDGQVPAFQAIYSGAIQCFGRRYGDDMRAMPMKAGQQLVFGEQIGWTNSNFLQRDEPAAFFRQMAQLRWKLRRYFYAGEMARPPKLEGEIPSVTADWQWSGENWIVTTDAVLTGAWRLPRENKVVLLFVNVSDEAVTATVSFDAADHDLPGDKVTIRRITAVAMDELIDSSAVFNRTFTIEPHEAWAWEVSASP